ncbi:hypothetical protein [Pedobacter heparinus]|uniref:hypothetical protein n=1 Tax=Pedobacter heparinus TaxID=984 RepID=UPI002931DC4B|nr:hypothetical protein [Pedobacter heparinus]
MKAIKMSLAFVLLSLTVFGQSIKFPMVGSSESPTTVITEIVTNSRNTVVSFKHICSRKGNWVQLNKSMYLQDANGEERYSYVRSEGIPLRPEKFVATEDRQEVNFKVYFEKLRPGTKEINVIERARSLAEHSNGFSFFNYFKVSLNKSQPEPGSRTVSTVDVVVAPPVPPNGDFASSFAKSEMKNLGPMISNMYSGMLTAQLNMYSNPATTDQLARIMKNYYDALIKTGFSSDAALKIITSKPLISADGKPGN